MRLLFWGVFFSDKKFAIEFSARTRLKTQKVPSGYSSIRTGYSSIRRTKNRSVKLLPWLWFYATYLH